MSPSFIRLRPLLALALSAIVTTTLLLAEPAWWVTRGVRDPAKPASDYAALNQGQLKNIARAACDEMNEKLPGGAGSAINNLVSSWNTPTADTKDYAMVNQGQLKAVAELFYQRYEQLGIPVQRPWTTIADDDSSHAAANIGHAKNIFSFHVLGDSDGDGVNDSWETANFGTLSRDLSLDADGDGLSDYAEWLAGTNALRWDTDGNGRADGKSARTPAALLIVYNEIEAPRASFPSGPTR